MKKIIAILFILISSTSYANTLNVILTADMKDSHSLLAKIFSDYLIKHLENTNKVVFKIVPGAGGINAANYLYNVASNDGNTIGILYKNVSLIGALDRNNSNIKFDASKFVWLGSLIDGRLDAGIIISNTPYQDNVTIGSDNNVIGNPIDFISRYTNLKFKKISGYRNPEEIRLAILKNEINSMASSLLATRIHHKEWLAKYHIIIQFGNGKIRNPNLLNIPTLNELIVNEEAKKALTIMENQFALIRPYVAPPNIPKNKAEALQRAFILASQDKEFIDQVRKIEIEISPIFHTEAQQIVNQTYSAPLEIIELIK